MNHTRESIQALTTNELAKLLGSVDYGQLGSVGNRFYVMLGVFSDEEIPMYAEVTQAVVVEYLVRLLTNEERDRKYD